MYVKTAGLIAVVIIGVALSASAPARPAFTPPVVAGYHRLKNDAKTPDAVAGELLLAELNCTACHKPDGAAAAERLRPKGAPDISAVGSRVTPRWLRSYLATPHALKPGATMPDVFHASDPVARDGAVEFLTHYLLSLGGPIQPSRKEGNVLLVEKGRNLYDTVGCVACHAPDGKKPAAGKIPSVPLGDLASKTTVEQLAAFLLDPLKTRPHGRMPASNLTTQEADALAIYLLREQLSNPQSESAEPALARGVKFSYYEGEFGDVDLDRLERRPVRAEGKADQFTIQVPERKVNDNFAFKFSGALKIPRDGKYTFSIRSDDGTRLYLDGKQLILNDGVHSQQERSASIELKTGDHPIVVTYFEANGEETLKVEWEGPEIPRQEIPGDALISVGGRPMIPLKNETLAVDPQKAETGKKMFAALGCASCHSMKDVPPRPAARAFAQLDIDSPDGCLSAQVRKGLPQYHLSELQRASIHAALNDRTGLTTAEGPRARVTRTMAALNCYACHERDGVGGPDASRLDHFVMTANFDMGDEGRLPPRLSGVGAKLRPPAMEKIITAGELHVRGHHMATRMPRFPKEQVTGFIRDVSEIDEMTGEAGPAFSELLVRDGRTLTGTKGMGCVNCHGVGDARSLGMPSVNLSTQHERLQWPWFRKLLIDPAGTNPGTRMPGFWTDGHIVYQKIAGGTVDGQIGAIWTYLSLGGSMPMPAGLRPEGAGMELIPIDEPIVHRTFMAEVGPRAIAVGFPDGLHVAFDANAVRLAKAWRGRFFDAKGMWEGRGGAAFGPLGKDVINLPPGPSFAMLETPDSPWPETTDRKQRDVGGQFKGYRLDKQRQPIFHYRIGEIDIEEQPMPVLREGGVVLVRKFRITGKPPAAGELYFLAAAAGKMQEQSPGAWRVDDRLTVRITAPAGAKPQLREGGGAKQLRLPIDLQADAATEFDVELAW